jgi:hypothetical protein
MKCLEDVRKIIDSYKIEPIKLPEGIKNIYQLINDIPEAKQNFQSEKDDFYLIKKYRKYISQGHYGFSIGSPINPKWNEVMDEILTYCISKDENFEIQQIKVKFGFMCFYVKSKIIEDIHEIEILIGKSLSDRAIVY